MHCLHILESHIVGDCKDQTEIRFGQITLIIKRLN